MNVHGFIFLCPLNYRIVTLTINLMLTGLSEMILITSTYFHCFQIIILYGIIFIYLY